MTLGDLLADLMSVPGLSGHEDRIRRRIAGIPVIGSRARIRTAEAIPSSSVTTLTQKCMP